MTTTTTALQAQQALYDAIRALGYTTRGQTGEIVDIVCSHAARAALSAPPAAQDAPSVPQEVVDLLLSGDLEAVLCRAGVAEDMRLKLYRGRQVILAARASQPATPAPDAAATVPDDLQDRIDAMGASRYKVVASDQSMFHRHAVVAGDGKQQLYLGREVECQNMAAKFTGAFLDGAFACLELLRATPPASQPTPAQDAAATVPVPKNPRPANPAKTCDMSLCMQSNECSYAPCQSATPPAPQAAPTAAHPVAGQGLWGTYIKVAGEVREKDAAPTAPQAVPLTDETLEQERALFERKCGALNFKREADGSYSLRATQVAWAAWWAARQVSAGITPTTKEQ